MNPLVLADRAIRADSEGRYCINDLHRAAGGEPRHRPGYWLELEQTKSLAAEIEKAGLPAIRAKQKVGTFVARELVYAFAMWISPAFHLQVIRSFDAAASRGQWSNFAAALQDPAVLRSLLLDHANARLELERQVDALKPRAAALDRLTDDGKSLSLTATAKVLQIRPRDFMDWLAGIGWIYRAGGFGEWQAHQRRIDSGHLEHRMVEIDCHGVIQLKAQAMVTPKGIARLAELREMPNAPAIAA